MERVSISVTAQGGLENCISASKKHLIQELRVLGRYCSSSNGPFIKSICNANDGEKGCLDTLDLSHAEIMYSVGINPHELRSDEFVNCKTLKKIVFSELNNLQSECFSGCTSLESIEYTGKRVFTSMDGILYQKGKWEVLNSKYKDFDRGKWGLVKYPSAKKESEAIRFDRVNSIADYAFEDFKLSDLYMPTVPPACTDRAFFNVDVSRITLHVPVGSYHSYWSHPVWGEFRIVEE